MKKGITLAAFLLLLKTISLAQVSSCAVSFSYDAAGNHTQRMLCVVNGGPGGLAHIKKEDAGAWAILSDGTDSVSDGSEFLFFPNPTSGIIKIKDAEQWLNSELSIFDTHGKIQKKILTSILKDKEGCFYETQADVGKLKEDKKNEETDCFN